MILLVACWKCQDFSHVSWWLFSCLATEHDNHVAKGHACVATGHACVATGHACVATRHACVAKSHACFATGHACVATSHACFATGHACVATSHACFATGHAWHVNSFCFTWLQLRSTGCHSSDCYSVQCTIFVHASQIILTCAADFS